MSARALAAAMGLAAASAAAPVCAEEDGAFGRLDGDVQLELAAGASLAAGGPSLTGRLTALYLSTAGLYAFYTDGLGGDADVARSISVGAELAPLFLGRYAKDLEHGPARLELFLDSFAIGLGAFWHDPEGGSFDSTPGLEVALSLEFPFLADATGPWLGVRGALRWRAEDLDGRGEGGVVDRGALLALSLAWHHIVPVHIVDAGDRRPSP